MRKPKLLSPTTRTDFPNLKSFRKHDYTEANQLREGSHSTDKIDQVTSEEFWNGKLSRRPCLTGPVQWEALRPHNTHILSKSVYHALSIMQPLFRN